MNTLYNVHVRVSRTWEYRGKSEKNPLIHFDMVVIDQMVWLHTPLLPIFTKMFFPSFFFQNYLYLILNIPNYRVMRCIVRYLHKQWISSNNIFKKERFSTYATHVLKGLSLGTELWMLLTFKNWSWEHRSLKEIAMTQVSQSMYFH